MPASTLEGWYEAYDQFCGISGVLGAACWAHARRKFIDALKEDKTLATQAIVMIGKLYAVEQEANEVGMTPDQRCALRREKAYPVIRLMEKWCLDTYANVLEKSLIGKAIAYTYSLMERLSVYINVCLHYKTPAHPIDSMSCMSASTTADTVASSRNTRY